MHNVSDNPRFDPSPGHRQGAERDVSRIIATLRGCRLCHGLSVEELHDLAEAIRPIGFRAGEIVCRKDDPGGSMYLVDRGRVKLAIEEGTGPYRLLEYLGRGDHFGEMSMLTGRRRLATATAVVDSELLELDNEHFQRLLGSVPAFTANLSRTLGFRLHLLTQGKPARWKSRVVALVNSTLRTQGLLRPLADALVSQGDELHILTTRNWPPTPTAPYSVQEFATGPDVDLPAAEELLRRSIEHHDRVLVDVTQRGLECELPRLLRQCEQIWWLVEPRFAESSLENLAVLLAADRSLRERLHLVWILRESEQFAPYWNADKLGIATLDFKVVLGEEGDPPSVARRQSISRLVRHLDGRRIGLALGGGGARGLAHLGVLRAFDRAGIDFDLMSGASSGALTGLSYAAGWPPDEALRLFKQDLTPRRLVRLLPGGSQWYMYAMFRLGAWERKLRVYASDASLEQLRIPFSTVAVDLVNGREIVRDRGDVVHAILESINLPVIAPPILRDGMALVDGGILNNLPGDVLPERGAALVVGIDVVARLPRRFARKITTPDGRFRKPGMLQTLLRVNEVQDYGITAIRAPAIDLIIAPDTSAFDFSDFTKGYELAEIGEAAAEEAIPQLRQMIADLSRD